MPSVQQLLAEAKPGDTVVLPAGTYGGYGELGSLTGIKGTAEAPIKLVAGGDVTFTRGRRCVTGWFRVPGQADLWMARCDCPMQDVGSAGRVRWVWLDNLEMADPVTMEIWCESGQKIDIRPLTAGKFDPAKMVRGMAWWERGTTNQGMLYLKTWDSSDPSQHTVEVAFWYGMFIEDCAYLTIEGVRSRSAGWLIGDKTQCPGITLRNCRFENAGIIDGHTTDLLIQNCTFRDIGITDLYQTIYGAGDNTTIDSCDFYNCSSVGGGTVTKNSYFHKPALWWQPQNFQGTCPPATQAGRHLAPWKGDAVIQNCVFEGPCTGIVCYATSHAIRDNVFVPANAGNVWISTKYTPCTVQNNIMRGPGCYILAADGTKLTATGNQYAGAYGYWNVAGKSYGSLADWQAAGYDKA